MMIFDYEENSDEAIAPKESDVSSKINDLYLREDLV